MHILVACEESQAVCTEMRKRGQDAYSCDIVDCSGGHPEWHIKGDVLPLLNPKPLPFGGVGISFTTLDGKHHLIHGKWDMIIAFPPCTHLVASGARHFAKKRADGRQRGGIEFFCRFLEADCERIAIENPVGIISGEYIGRYFPDIADAHGLPRKPAQIIQPWMFGDDAGKSTCLWLKGLPMLRQEVFEQPETKYHTWVDGKTGRKKRMEEWYYKTRCLPYRERGRAASKTFPGVAGAMAEQWT